MSIHKSKGLEFPVVIVAGCGKSFNFQDMNRRLLVHHDLGFGPDYVDPERRIAYPTLAKRPQIQVEAGDAFGGDEDTVCSLTPAREN